MTYQIGQIPTHYTAPLQTYKIEVENPTGPVSGYSTLAEVSAAIRGNTAMIPYFGQNTIVQTDSTAATAVITVLVPIPPGSLILVVAAESTTGGAGSSAITDSAGNTYTATDTLFPNNSNANGFMRLWQCANCKGVQSPGWIKYTAAATAQKGVAVFMAFTNPNATPFDAASNATATGSSATISLAEGTPTAAGEITIGMYMATGTTASTWGNLTGDFSPTGTRAGFILGYLQTNLRLIVGLIFNELGTARTLAAADNPVVAAPWCAKVIALQ